MAVPDQAELFQGTARSTVLEDLRFFAKAEKPQFTNVLKWPKSTRLRQRFYHSQILEVGHI
jgi:hypothetical protein